MSRMLLTPIFLPQAAGGRNAGHRLATYLLAAARIVMLIGGIFGLVMPLSAQQQPLQGSAVYNNTLVPPGYPGKRLDSVGGHPVQSVPSLGDRP